MSTVKRPINGTEENPTVESATIKKKAGRKLLSDSDAKNKRTAQNRAAQRAFRERKEKKMKELEDKVSELEQARKHFEIESDFLRIQLSLMVNELKNYRPESKGDLKVLEYLANYEKSHDGKGSDGNKGSVDENIERKKNFTFHYPVDDDKLPSPSDSTKNLSNSISTPNSSTTSSSTGWMDTVFYNDVAQNLPHFKSGSKTNLQSDASKVNNEIMIPDKEDKIALRSGYDSEFFSNDFNFNDQFDEQVASFCVKMNSVCGTRDDPVPKPNKRDIKNTAKSEISKSSPAPLDGLDSLSTQHTPIEFTNKLPSQINMTDQRQAQIGAEGFEINPNNDFFNTLNEPSLLLSQTDLKADFDNNVDNATKAEPAKYPFLDPTLAFPNENKLFFREPSSIETGEKNDLFDDLLDENNSGDDDDLILKNLVNQEPSKSANLTTTDSLKSDWKIKSDDDFMVPSSDDALLKCSEVWDRITSHPRYSDIDIDGLCEELMHNAKCSEKGVVVDSKDVQKALTRHLS